MVSYKALNTIVESLSSNTCHRIRNRDGGEAAAFRESPISNTCHRIYWIFKSNRFGNNYVTWIISALRYCGGCLRNVIANSIHLNNICRCRNWEEHAKNERCQTCSKSFFHNFLPDTYCSHEVGCWQWVKPPYFPRGGFAMRRRGRLMLFFILFAEGGLT